MGGRNLRSHEPQTTASFHGVGGSLITPQGHTLRASRSVARRPQTISGHVTALVRGPGVRSNGAPARLGPASSSRCRIPHHDRLSGGVAIVTGGGGAGSGRAIARRLARAGSSVVIADVNDAGAGATADIIAAERGTAVVFHADVASESDVRSLIDCVVSGWIASPPVQAYVDSVPPEHRRDRGVPERLLTTDEVAGAVFALATSSNLAGGVLLLRNEEPPAPIAAGDPGYSRLEPVSFALT